MPYSVPKNLPDKQKAALSDLNEAFRDNDWAINFIKNSKLRCYDDVKRVLPLAASGEILNIGGAPYIFEVFAAVEGLNVTSIDLDPARHQAAIDRLGLTVRKADIENAQERQAIDLARYDVICMCEVFEHMRIDLIGLLTDLHAGMNSDARLYLTTPNFFCARKFLRRLRARRSGPSLVSAWSKLSNLGHMGHVRVYSRAELTELFEHIGFIVEDFRTRNRLEKAGRSFRSKIWISLCSFLEAKFDLFGDKLIFVLRRK